MRTRAVPVDPYADLSPQQLVGGALSSLVLALSYGGYDVHGGVPVSVVDRLSESEVSFFVTQEALSAINKLAFDLQSTRENAFVAVCMDFVADPPRDPDFAAIEHVLRRCFMQADFIADRRPTPRTLESFYWPAHHVDAVSDSTDWELRSALDSAEGPSDSVSEYRQRLVYAVGEFVDRTVRLRVRSCDPSSDIEARSLATSMIRSWFSFHGLSVPDIPITEDDDPAF